MLKPLTQEEFSALSPKARWDITVALRGPDLRRAEIAKWFTTSVLRGRMREVIRVGGLVNPDLNLVIVPGGAVTPEHRDKIGLFSLEHFIGHVGEAASWLQIPIAIVPATEWVDAVLASRSVKEAADRLLPLIPSEKKKAELTRHLGTGLHYF